MLTPYDILAACAVIELALSLLHATRSN